eukprot:128741_1
MALTLFAFLNLLLYCINSQSQPNPTPSAGCGVQSAGSGTFQAQYGGYNRLWIVYQPVNYNINTAIPLVFAFHGYTGTAQGMKNGFNGDKDADEQNYLMVYVQSTSGANRNSWNDIGCSLSPGPNGCSGNGCNQPTCNYATVQDVPIPSNCPPDQGPNNNDGYCNWCNCNVDDLDWINELAIRIENNYCIDMSREYALGYSQGGMMAHRVGCNLNHRFAAIAPFHGQQQIGFNCEQWSNDNIPIGLFNVWGTNDGVVCGESPTAPNQDACESNDGYWYTKVSAVQRRFAQHNGCSVSGNPVVINTPQDGTRNWQCTGYTEGCIDSFYVMQCNWNGAHSYPNTLPPNSYNFGLVTAIQYFYQFQRSLKNEKYRKMYNKTKKY